MSEPTPDPLAKAIAGVNSFAEAMKTKGIHLGMGSNPTCVCCGETWPCSTERSVDD